MNTFIGIDLGTSSIKLLLVNSNGKILAEATESYPVDYPKAGWTEQKPQNWLMAAQKAMHALLINQDANAVRGISFGGQMHGLVVLDDQDNVIRPCILWNDGRTEKQTEFLNGTIGKKRLSDLTGNIAFAGFTAPKLLWLRENEPQNFAKISKIMLPKDYLAYWLCGTFCTDYSDASGTLLLDVEHRCWSQEMCKICGITTKQLPALFDSYQVVGTLKPALAKQFGLPDNVKICAGAGDNAAAAVGTGSVGNGSCNVSLGTSGTIFISADNFSVDDKNALHSFCHATGHWHLMGCILSAASCRKWWLEDVLGNGDYAKDETDVSQTDSGEVLFLPYLSGERSPHNDVNAKGAFVGLTATTTKAQMSRAVMEGVAFALRDCLEVARLNGVNPASTNLCGGGAKSKVWRQIVADVFNLPVNILSTEQGPAYGGAILAMVGCNQFSTVKEACNQIVSVAQTVLPNPYQVARYNAKYQKFVKLYPLLKQLY